MGSYTIGFNGFDGILMGCCEDFMGLYWDLTNTNCGLRGSHWGSDGIQTAVLTLCSTKNPAPVIQRGNGKSAVNGG